MARALALADAAEDLVEGGMSGVGGRKGMMGGGGGGGRGRGCRQTAQRRTGARCAGDELSPRRRREEMPQDCSDHAVRWEMDTWSCRCCLCVWSCSCNCRGRSSKILPSWWKEFCHVTRNAAAQNPVAGSVTCLGRGWTGAVTVNPYKVDPQAVLQWTLACLRALADVKGRQRKPLDPTCTT